MDGRHILVSAFFDICKVLPKIYSLGADHFNKRSSTFFFDFPLKKVLFKAYL